jgi:hypothetical protein
MLDQTTSKIAIGKSRNVPDTHAPNNWILRYDIIIGWVVVGSHDVSVVAWA